MCRIRLGITLTLLLTSSIAWAVTPQLNVSIPTQASLQVKFVTKLEEKIEQYRRCAFLGRCGSFFLTGSEGKAAYILGNNKFIADLVSAGEDPNWWTYRPVSNGDASTTMWAFARRPQCGKYAILRFSNGAWRQYDQANAWGDGLGQSGGSFAAGAAGPSNQELLEKLRDIEGKLNAIQPGQRPSLLDIERQLNTKP